MGENLANLGATKDKENEKVKKMMYKEGSLVECETFYNDKGELEYQKESCESRGVGCHCHSAQGQKGARVRVQVEWLQLGVLDLGEQGLADRDGLQDHGAARGREAGSHGRSAEQAVDNAWCGE